MRTTTESERESKDQIEQVCTQRRIEVQEREVECEDALDESDLGTKPSLEPTLRSMSAMMPRRHSKSHRVGTIQQVRG